MGLMARLQVLTASIVSIASVALIYAEVAKPLVEMGTGNGEFTGPFSDVISQLDTLVPLVLVLLLLGMVIWLIASSVREEKARRLRRP